MVNMLCSLNTNLTLPFLGRSSRAEVTIPSELRESHLFDLYKGVEVQRGAGRGAGEFGKSL